MTPAPPQRHVLRLDLVHDDDDDDDDDGDGQRHVLVAVWPTKDAENILDMEFLATDDTKAYVTTLSHARIARYRASKTACPESDWEDALKALLLADRPPGDVQATARIADDGNKPSGDARGYMFIDVIKKVSATADVTLGSLKLRKSEKARDSIDLFDWCAEVATARDKLALDVGKLQREHDALKALVAEETAQIKDLACSKQEFETTHDSWLKDLLNEKKVKIRTQEQLLTTARINPDKLAAATVSRTGAAASRPGKRKADVSDADDASHDGTDKMDLDVADEPTSHDEELGDIDRATTVSEETASDSDLDADTKKKSASKTASRASSAAGSSKTTSKTDPKVRDRKVVTPDESEDEAPPREKSHGTKKKPTPAPEIDPADLTTESE